MIIIKVIDKSTKALIWTEHHSSRERANEELQHMKENHFNPKYFTFKISENHLNKN